jgi:hypothetical protein
MILKTYNGREISVDNLGRFYVEGDSEIGYHNEFRQITEAIDIQKKTRKYPRPSIPVLVVSVYGDVENAVFKGVNGGNQALQLDGASLDSAYRDPILIHASHNRCVEILQLADEIGYLVARRRGLIKKLLDIAKPIGFKPDLGYGRDIERARASESAIADALNNQLIDAKEDLGAGSPSITE